MSQNIDEKVIDALWGINSFFKNHLKDKDKFKSRARFLKKFLPEGYHHICEMASLSLLSSTFISRATTAVSQFEQKLIEYDNREKEVELLVENSIYDNTKILVEYFRDKIADLPKEKRKLIKEYRKKYGKDNDDKSDSETDDPPTKKRKITNAETVKVVNSFVMPFTYDKETVLNLFY